jgi:hypothetical protein
LFHSVEDVHLWMIDQHLGRRSVSDFQRGVLALRKREILADRKLAASLTVSGSENELPSSSPTATTTSPVGTEPAQSREDLARLARLSSNQVVMIERIQKQAAAEVVAAVKSGTISINAAAAVATLPEQEQIAAALGGPDELRQAAKRVRDTKKRMKADSPEIEGEQSVADLKARIAELLAENVSLRQQLEALKA